MQPKKQLIVDGALPPASAPPTESRFRVVYNSLVPRRTPLSLSPSCLPSLSPSPSRPTVISVLALPKTRASSTSATRPRRTSHCETMLRLSLARDDHAQSSRKSGVFDAAYSSPDGTESSCSRRSRSPSPQSRPVGRHASLSRTSHTRAVSYGMPTLPRSQTHPTSLSAHATLGRPPCNEDVLRSRLEGVLSSASTSRDVSCPPSPSHRRRGDSFAFGLITPPHGSAMPPPPPPMARSRTSPATSRSSRKSTTSPSPITPPPSPPFDANRIALQLRDREGYVSFADVQGLGVPHGVDDDEDEDPDRGRGRWWSLWKG